MTKPPPAAMRLIGAILTLSLFAPTVLVYSGCVSASREVSAQNAAPPALTNDDVIQMVKANLSQSLILNQIRSSRTDFDLSSDEVIRLSTGGVSDTIIAEMGQCPRCAEPGAGGVEPVSPIE
jgi:hypothetical protein